MKSKEFSSEFAVYKYEAHNAHVMRHCPPEKLLVYDIRDGWKPLCNFLGKSEPTVMFPHNNKNSSITAEFQKSRGLIMNQVHEEVKLRRKILVLTIPILYFLTKAFGDKLYWIQKLIILLTLYACLGQVMFLRKNRN